MLFTITFVFVLLFLLSRFENTGSCFVAMRFAVEVDNADIYNDISSPIEKATDEKISTVVTGRVDEGDWFFWDICRDICRNGLRVGGIVGSSGYLSRRDHASRVNEGFIADRRRLEGFAAEVTKGVFDFVVAQNDKTTFLAGHGMRDARFFTTSITG